MTTTRAAPGRRRRWVRLGLLLVLAPLFAVAVYGFVVEPATLVERDHVLPLPGWPARCDGLRVDVIADTHTGSPHNGLDALDRWVARVADGDADVVLLAGDYVILSVLLGEYIPAHTIARHLEPLVARKPVYAVLGNHDWWKNGDAVAQAFSRAGITMMDNRAQRVDAAGCRFWLVGLGDQLEGSPDVAGTFARVADDDAPVIVLTHGPDLFAEIPARASLTVAGHTHGGQIDPWPLDPQPGRFVEGSHRLKWHLVDGDRHLFVSPGIGTSILPLRLGVPPEISRLELRSEAGNR